MSDHKSIWLEPEPPMDDDEVGRTWCQDDVYEPDEYDGNKPTLYIRADLYKELEAQLKDMTLARDEIQKLHDITIAQLAEVRELCEKRCFLTWSGKQKAIYITDVLAAIRKGEL